MTKTFHFLCCHKLIQKKIFNLSLESIPKTGAQIESILFMMSMDRCSKDNSITRLHNDCRCIWALVVMMVQRMLKDSPSISKLLMAMNFTTFLSLVTQRRWLKICVLHLSMKESLVLQNHVNSKNTSFHYDQSKKPNPKRQYLGQPCNKSAC